jgi:hypothetical protein
MHLELVSTNIRALRAIPIGPELVARGESPEASEDRFVFREDVQDDSLLNSELRSTRSAI